MGKKTGDLRSRFTDKERSECLQEWDAEMNAPYTVDDAVFARKNGKRGKAWVWKCTFCGKTWKEGVIARISRSGKYRTCLGCEDCRKKALEIVDADTGTVYADYKDLVKRYNIKASASFVQQLCLGLLKKPNYNLKYTHPEIRLAIFTTYNENMVSSPDGHAYDPDKALAEAKMEWDNEKNAPYTIEEALTLCKTVSYLGRKWAWKCSICGNTWDEGLLVKIYKKGKRRTCLGCNECRKKAHEIVDNETGKTYETFTKAAAALDTSISSIKNCCDGNVGKYKKGINVSYAYPDIRRYIFEGNDGKGFADMPGQETGNKPVTLRGCYDEVERSLNETDIPCYGIAKTGMIPIALLDIDGKCPDISEFAKLYADWDLSKCFPITVSRVPESCSYRVIDGIKRVIVAAYKGEKELPAIINDREAEPTAEGVAENEPELNIETLASAIWSSYGIPMPFESVNKRFRRNLTDGLEVKGAFNEIRWIMDILVRAGWIGKEVMATPNFILALRRIYRQLTADNEKAVRDVLIETMLKLRDIDIIHQAGEKYPEFDKRTRRFYFLTDIIKEKTGISIVSKTMPNRVKRKSGPGSTYRSVVEEYLKEHPDDSVHAIAKATGLNIITVRNHCMEIDPSYKFNPRGAKYAVVDKFREKHPEMTPREIADKFGMDDMAYKRLCVHMGVSQGQENYEPVAMDYSAVDQYHMQNPDLTVTEIADVFGINTEKRLKRLKMHATYFNAQHKLDPDFKPYKRETKHVKTDEACSDNPDKAPLKPKVKPKVKPKEASSAQPSVIPESAVAVKKDDDRFGLDEEQYKVFMERLRNSTSTID